MSARVTGVQAEQRLRRALIAFFLALAVPAALLAWHAWGQVRWQVLHQYRTLAEELAGRIDAALGAAVAREDARSFADYGFLVVDAAAGGGLALSPLARVEAATLPGLVGHFQVDSAGRYSSPLLPPSGTLARDFGIDAGELARRRALDARLRAILAGPAARAAPPADALTVASDGTATTTDAERDTAEHAGGAVGAAPRDVAARAKTNVFERLTNAQQAFAGRDAGYGKSIDSRRVARQQAGTDELTGSAPAAIASSDGPPSPARASRREQVAMLASPAPEARATTAPPAAALQEGVPAQLADARGDATSAVADAAVPATAPRAARAPVAGVTGSTRAPRIRLFESELDPFVLQALDGAHFVLFRNVWRDGERYVQGAVIERAAFLEGAVMAAYRESLLAPLSDLAVAFGGTIIAHVRGSGEATGHPAQVAGEPLYRTRLSAPLSDLELVFGIAAVPLGASGAWLAWLTVALLLVLVVGCYAIYRFARGHLRLVRQQQDFVAAVSHELKTPLTAIRMYSELLEAGWADERKKAGWYTYIRVEAERLSRLIANVLTLARMERGHVALELAAAPLGALLERIGARLASPIAAAGFSLDVAIAADVAATPVAVDEDAFTQVLLNLVDNAIKFTPDGAPRRIVLGAHRLGAAQVAVTVRDHGAGVPRAERRRIFELFYRADATGSRDKPGTGIGLALVRELMAAMHGDVTVTDAAPGALFTLTLPHAVDD
ncbi:MAG: HAMP domain-containing sensor histidine kinase [Gammaproteobacteria bacterium]